MTRSVDGSPGVGPAGGEDVDEVAADALQGGDHPGHVVLGAVEAVEEVLDPRHEAVGVLGGQADDGRGRPRSGSGWRTRRRSRTARRRRSRRPSGGRWSASTASARSTAPGENRGLSSWRYLMCSGGSIWVGTKRYGRVGLPRRERLAGEEVDVLVQLLHRVVAGDDPVALGVGVEERRRLLAQRRGLGPVAAGLLVVEHGELLDRAPTDVPGHRARIDRVIQQTDHFPSRTHVSRRPTDPLSAPSGTLFIMMNCCQPMMVRHAQRSPPPRRTRATARVTGNGLSATR